MSAPSPLIVTLKLDEVSSAYFDAMRKLYFPPAINYLAAHLTLFHNLPPEEPVIQKDLEQWCNETSILELNVTEIKSIGKGVAFTIFSPLLSSLHKKMQVKWSAWLTPQDKQKLWPHITVQNKVSPTEAQETRKTLQATFEPFTAKGLGFRLWSYEGGPWNFIDDYLFANA